MRFALGPGPARTGKRDMAATSRESTTAINTRAKRIIWLPALVFVISVVGLGLLAAYSALNLRPDLSAVHTSESRVLIKWVILFAVTLPTIAAMIHVWPIARWLRGASPGELHGIDAAIAQRAANVPLALAAFSVIGWTLIFSRHRRSRDRRTCHAIRSGGAFCCTPATRRNDRRDGYIFFCGIHLPRLCMARTADRHPIVGNPRLHRVRLSHRLLVLWLAISALPLGAVASMTYTRVAGVDLAADPALGRIVSVVLLIAISAAVGGAWLAWLVSVPSPSLLSARGGDGAPA